MYMVNPLEMLNMWKSHIEILKQSSNVVYTYEGTGRYIDRDILVKPYNDIMRQPYRDNGEARERYHN